MKQASIWRDLWEALPILALALVAGAVLILFALALFERHPGFECPSCPPCPNVKVTAWCPRPVVTVVCPVPVVTLVCPRLPETGDEQ